MVFVAVCAFVWALIAERKALKWVPILLILAPQMARADTGGSPGEYLAMGAALAVGGAMLVFSRDPAWKALAVFFLVLTGLVCTAWAKYQGWALPWGSDTVEVSLEGPNLPGGQFQLPYEAALAGYLTSQITANMVSDRLLDRIRQDKEEGNHKVWRGRLRGSLYEGIVDKSLRRAYPHRVASQVYLDTGPYKVRLPFFEERNGSPFFAGERNVENGVSEKRIIDFNVDEGSTLTGIEAKCYYSSGWRSMGRSLVLGSIALGAQAYGFAVGMDRRAKELNFRKWRVIYGFCNRPPAWIVGVVQAAFAAAGHPGKLSIRAHYRIRRGSNPQPVKVQGLFAWLLAVASLESVIDFNEAGMLLDLFKD